jgi:hypothetical protein
MPCASLYRKVSTPSPSSCPPSLPVATHLSASSLAACPVRSACTHAATWQQSAPRLAEVMLAAGAGGTWMRAAGSGGAAALGTSKQAWTRHQQLRGVGGWCLGVRAYLHVADCYPGMQLEGCCQLVVVRGKQQPAVHLQHTSRASCQAPPTSPALLRPIWSNRALCARSLAAALSSASPRGAAARVGSCEADHRKHPAHDASPSASSQRPVS